MSSRFYTIERRDAMGRGRDKEHAANEDEDDALMRQAAQDNDREAFALLVRRHREWVLRLLVSMTRCRDAAEDVTQEVFGRIYTHRAAYRPCGLFVPYVKRVAVNAARNYLREQARRSVGTDWKHRRRRRADAITGPEDWRDVEEREAGSESDPEAALHSRLLEDTLRDAISTLSREQRQVIALHYFGGKSVAAIAAALDCPAGTIKSRLFHARRHLRRILTAQGHES